MNWMDSIRADSGIWGGVTGYAEHRISELTAVCVAAESTDMAIRQAQAGIDELRRLIALPTRLTATAQQMARHKQTTGY